MFAVHTDSRRAGSATSPASAATLTEVAAVSARRGTLRIARPEESRTYHVDFDDYFVLHVLDEVVTCVHDESAQPRKEIKRV